MESDRAKLSTSSFSHHASSPDTFQEEAAVAGGEKTLLEGSLGPWHLAKPACLCLPCACLPVSLQSFINAAICGVKISLLFAPSSMAARSRRKWRLKAFGWFLDHQWRC